MIRNRPGLLSLENTGHTLLIRAATGLIVFVVVVTGLPFDPQIRSGQDAHGLHGLVERTLQALVDPIRTRTAHADDDDDDRDRSRKDIRRIKRRLDALIKLVEGIAAGGGGLSLDQHDLNIQGRLDALEQQIQEISQSIGGGDPSKIVFITSSTHTGDLGGLGGGDAICNTRAAEAGLPGRYAAWLSDATESPLTRFVRSRIPYVLVDRTTVIANDFTDLTDGSIGSPISLDETGAVGGALTVWTGTQSTGTSAGLDCNGWTEGIDNLVRGVSGERDITTSPTSWTFVGGTQCTGEKSLYCFQQ